MKHHANDIPNSILLEVLEEWSKSDRDKALLIDHYIRGHTFAAIAENYDLSDQRVKKIIYDVGDPILFRARKLAQIRARGNE